jgi:hypothetical protein
MKKAITILLLLFVFGSTSAQIPVFSATTTWRVADGNNTWVGTALQNKTYLAAGTLSKVDDTNVTLTLGGTPASALFNSVSITAGWTGTLAATRGGTGLGSLGSSKSDTSHQFGWYGARIQCNTVNRHRAGSRHNKRPGSICRVGHYQHHKGLRPPCYDKRTKRGYFFAAQRLGGMGYRPFR